jgi:hypothetical protein
MVADVLVDPAALDVELLGRKPNRTENAETSGAAHRRDDVTAVRESEDRNFDSQSFAELRLHCVSSLSGTAVFEVGGRRRLSVDSL